MSLFGKLFRTTAAAASVAIGAGSALAQQPSAPPARLDVPSVSGQEAVTPASGFGRGTFGLRSNAAPCAPCTPATPCPVTGQPMTTPSGTPVTPPPVPPGQGVAQAPDFGDLSRGADVGQNLILDGGYIESAAPRSMVRLRFDSAYGNNRPDRGEFFYSKCGCFRPQPNSNGPPRPERNVDSQELSATGEVAFTERASAFFTLPVRFINPDLNQNAAGLSDISFGGKYALVYNESRVISLMLRFQAPSGSLSDGLGNGNWWVEPGILFLERLSAKWQMFGEFRFLAPLGTRSDFTGNLIRYGLGTSYVVAQGQWGYIAPVAELVGWTVLSGKELNPDALTAVRASGDTIVNAKFGVRMGFGEARPGSYSATRSDLYVGYGRALTGEVWYKDLVRVEYRRFF